MGFDGSGKIWMLINTGTNADPLFNTKVYIENGKFGLDLIVQGWSARPVVFDIDLDGRKDLLSGSANGLIFCYLNQGTDADPFFDGCVEAVAVVVKDDQVVFQGGYGVKTLGQATPVTARTPIAIGSQTTFISSIAYSRMPMKRPSLLSKWL